MLHSDGTQERDCIYVDDVNRLNRLCMEHPKAPGQIFNVGSGVATSVRKVYEIIAGAMSSSVEPAYRPATKFWDAYPAAVRGAVSAEARGDRARGAQHSLADTNKSREMLGWRAEVPVEEGLARTARYAMKLAGRNSPNKSG